ncbi:uncharacterized protein Dana_GF27040 [Drosophila ananassae]|uniref:Gustatory receptor n=1 Tax=Drosophila ananassae TaxID=7217 RepID=A0A0P8XFY9_DROAN|nr:uncharacterized protein Dana_GF27040 [Drosophila ananassae]
MCRAKRRFLGFLRHQRYFGLSDLDFPDSISAVWLRGSWLSFGIQILVAFVFVSALVAALAESLYYLDTGTNTGKIFDNAVIISTSLTQLFANLWFRCHQNSQSKLLQRLSQMKLFGQLDARTENAIQWIYRTWLAICLFYILMIAMFAFKTWLTSLQFGRTVILLGFFFRCIQANYLFTCYSGMVCVMQGILRIQGEQLEQLVATDSLTIKSLAGSLRTHDLILLLGQSELVDVYGGSLLFLFLYQVMQCVLISYITTLDMFHSMRELILVSGWLTPLIFYIILPLAVNDVFNQKQTIK